VQFLPEEGIPQLESLAFQLEPQVHDFADLRCGCDISSESSDVLDRLKIGFGIEETEWGHDNLPVEYTQFYDDLADMLPQIKARELTPRKTATPRYLHPQYRRPQVPCRLETQKGLLWFRLEARPRRFLFWLEHSAV
jgi:hypothetical protein